jgi:hypothetical protein
MDGGALPIAPAKDGAGKSAVGKSGARPGYFEHSRTPLVSLVFILPLIVIYEVGTGLTGAADPSRGGTPQHIIAFTLLQQFFSLFGATGQHLPAMAVAGILIAWHVARRDPWKVRWTTLGGIATEALLLSVPLIAMGIALAHLFRAVPLAASPTHGVVSTLPPRDLLVLCLGAGIYEELVFRLIILTVLSLVIKDLLLFPAKMTGLTVVVLSAVMFSAYHYLGNETFHWHAVASWRTFAFRTLAGIYFGVLFLTRGFGVTAATHAAYDILILLALP